MRREEMLARVDARDTPWDIVIIGGGATGIGIAVDAASEGMKSCCSNAKTSAKQPPAAPQSWSTAACAISNKATSRS